MSPRVVPDPRPAIVAGYGFWALSLASVAAGCFVVGASIVRRLYPLPDVVEKGES